VTNFILITDDIRAYFIDRLATENNSSKLQETVAALAAENTKQKQRLDELEAEVSRLNSMAVREAFSRMPQVLY
jgi:cell division protein FtsB